MEKMSLPELAREQLQRAAAEVSGRAAVTVVGGRQHHLRQTVMALTAGSSLSEHNNPGEASLQIVSGHVRLESSGGDAVDGWTGDLLVIPQSRHSLSALDDSTVLLTAVTLPTPPGTAGRS